MLRVTDILVRNPAGDTLATIEIKNRQNLSSDVAADLRRNLVAHGMTGPASYFMILSQDAGFLWKDPGSIAPEAAPTQEFSMRDVVSRYFSHSGNQERLSESVLELLVLQWLNELAASNNGASGEPEKLLAASGFLESLRGATILAEVRV